MIEFDEPNTLEYTNIKAKCCYDQSKHRQEPLKDWKRRDKLGFQRKGFKPSQYKNPKKGAQFDHLSISMHQWNFPSQSQNRPGKQVRECNTLFPPTCKYNWTGQELWKTHKCEYVM
jgi:hypothetical protein